MRTALLNLPYPVPIVRKYVCTYCVSNFLFPPMELMYLSAIIKEWKKDDCILIDAIAEGLNPHKVIKRLEIYGPQLLVFMAGIESFNEDMRSIMAIRSKLPDIKIACAGYLPSIFPKETLQNNPAIDYIIMDEPEISFSELYDEIKGRKDRQDIAGIAQRIDKNIIVAERRPRIRDLDTIPFSDHSSVNINSYNEFLLKRPFTTMQTSRGCPFECTYCIPTYGREVAFRSVENVLYEIEKLVLKYDVKAIRFIDDTFTLNKDRVLSLCSLILKRKLKFQWTALSRVGMLDKEMVDLMKRSGLRRIYLGIETGSQRLLDYYRKGYQANLIREQVRILKDENIEAAGFFMVGGLQTKEEFLEDVALAKRLNLDYVNVSNLAPYPGTALFDEMKEKDGVIFNLFPYSSTFKDRGLQERGVTLARSFYNDFYIDPRYFVKMLKFLFLNPRDLIIGAKRVLQFVFYHQKSCEDQPRFI